MENILINHLKVGDKVWNVIKQRWERVRHISDSIGTSYEMMQIFYTKEGKCVNSDIIPTIYLQEWDPRIGDLMPNLPELLPFKKGDLVWVAINKSFKPDIIRQYQKQKDNYYLASPVNFNEEYKYEICLPYDAHPLINNISTLEEYFKLKKKGKLKSSL